MLGIVCLRIVVCISRQLPGVCVTRGRAVQGAPR